MDNFDTHLEYIKDALKKNNEDHKLLFKKMDNWIDSCEERFAPSWVGDAMKWTMAIMFGALLLAVVNLVLK